MADPKNDPRSVDTGGAAYVGGNVDTGGGDFVGRDQVKMVRQEGVSAAELTKLLAEVRTLLPQAGLRPEEAQAIEGDFRVVEDQAAQAQPKAALIKGRLKGASELIREAGTNADAVDKILKLLGRGLALVTGLF
jgi:hypothetical protein